MQLPKFEGRITEKLIQPQFDQKSSSGYGIIMEYDALTNTATVVMANSGSGDVGDLYRNVPCPTQVGVQGVAPEPGRPCFVSFKDQSFNQPFVTTYWNHRFEDIDYQRQTKAVNATPRYLLYG